MSSIPQPSYDPRSLAFTAAAIKSRVEELTRTHAITGVPAIPQPAWDLQALAFVAAVAKAAVEYLTFRLGHTAAAIPHPGATPQAILVTLMALKQAVEALG